MIDVQSLSRAYGEFLAVDDVSFSISGGEIVGLLGPTMMPLPGAKLGHRDEVAHDVLGGLGLSRAGLSCDDDALVPGLCGPLEAIPRLGHVLEGPVGDAVHVRLVELGSQRLRPVLVLVQSAIFLVFAIRLLVLLVQLVLELHQGDLVQEGDLLVRVDGDQDIRDVGVDLVLFESAFCVR